MKKTDSVKKDSTKKTDYLTVIKAKVAHSDTLLQAACTNAHRGSNSRLTRLMDIVEALDTAFKNNAGHIKQTDFVDIIEGYAQKYDVTTHAGRAAATRLVRRDIACLRVQYRYPILSKASVLNTNENGYWFARSTDEVAAYFKTTGPEIKAWFTTRLLRDAQERVTFGVPAGLYAGVLAELEKVQYAKVEDE